MEFNLRGKVTVITGASSGIGRAIAVEMAKCGSDIVLNYLSNDEGAASTADEIKKQGAGVAVVKADVSKKEEADRLIDTAIKEFEKVDVLVNNAGSVFRRSTFLDLDEELWDLSIRVNLKSVYLCSRAAIPYMIENNGGCIINMSSVAGKLGSPGETVHYAVPKAGINILTVGLAKEFGAKGIRVNAIAPGTVETPLLDKSSTPVEWKESRIKKTLLGRMGTTNDIAPMAVFLASECGSFITGQIIEISGGRF